MELVGVNAAAEKAAQVLSKFRSDGQKPIFVQHIATNPQARFFQADSRGVKLHKSIEPKPSEKIIVKHHPNSFRDTSLLEYLRKHEISELVVCGMMTHMCVDTTVRAAAEFGFSCTVIGDACATLNLEHEGRVVDSQDVQSAFLAALDGSFAQVKTAQQYLQ